ncbi:MAG: stage II sporulation protein R, partial [Clostridia bacterium]|nr:stage II sporulation protein R [Clostridia bacterium]
MTVKNRLLAAAVAALMLLCALCLFPLGERRAHADEVLRLHILANSDSEADQRVKLLVRDAILAVMEPCGELAEAEAWLLANGRLVLETAERVRRENGFHYGAQLMLGESEFPDRVYGGTLYPAGSYYALRVVLGSGAGHNWWCVLFPPLCIVTADAEELPN